MNEWKKPQQLLICPAALWISHSVVHIEKFPTTNFFFFDDLQTFLSILALVHHLASHSIRASYSEV